MKVYLDLVMGLNFIVDLLLLLGTNRLSGFPPAAMRCSAAAALGGGYGGMCLVPGFSFLGNTHWRIVFLVLIGLIAFGLNRSAWKRTGIFVLLTMAMGGLALSVGKAELPALVLSGAAVWLLCQIGFGGQVGGREYVQVTVTEGTNTVSVMALKDTGNRLCDPITGQQILILGPKEAEKLLELRQMDLQNPMQTMLDNPGRGFRLIPYRAVGQPGGLLLGKRFSSVKLGNRKTSGVIAFSPETIGSGDVYQALAGGLL